MSGWGMGGDKLPNTLYINALSADPWNSEEHVEEYGPTASHAHHVFSQIGESDHAQRSRADYTCNILLIVFPQPSSPSFITSC